LYIALLLLRAYYFREFKHNAINASYQILMFFKKNNTEEVLKEYLREKIYPFVVDNEGKSYGLYSAGSVENQYK